MSIRRVVTGHDQSGSSVFVSDEFVEPICPDLLPGYVFHQLWQGSEPPTFPDSGSEPELSRYFPQVGGFRFSLVTIPAAGTSTKPVGERAAALRQMEELLPGLFDYHEPGGTGMHTTPTIDFEIVLEGHLLLELDDGATVELGPGDTVVQNGTRHRWVNHTDAPARYAVFLVGAHAPVIRTAHDERDAGLRREELAPPSRFPPTSL